MRSGSTGVEIREAAPGRFVIRGSLTFDTARAAREEGIRCFGGSGARDLEVSLRGVDSADSAGLAVLIDWLALAARTARRMRLVDLPEQIRAIARISEVEELLETGGPDVAPA